MRGEERNLAVKNFSSKDIFVFLLSTKAGDGSCESIIENANESGDSDNWQCLNISVAGLQRAVMCLI